MELAKEKLHGEITKRGRRWRPRCRISICSNIQGRMENGCRSTILYHINRLLEVNNSVRQQKNDQASGADRSFATMASCFIAKKGDLQKWMSISIVSV